MATETTALLKGKYSAAFGFHYLVFTLCYVSYHFLPRDAICKLGLCCCPVSVRPSVHPSVSLVHYIQTAEDVSSNFFLGPIARSFVFWPAVPIPNSNGEPLQQ